MACVVRTVLSVIGGPGTGVERVVVLLRNRVH